MAKYKTGLVLSGGAARGFAHLGVLKALEECGIEPDIISGVSAGSIAGALFADGYTPDEIMDIYSVTSIFDLIQVTVPKTGLFSAKGLRHVLKKNLRAKNIEDLKIPMVITVTNMLEGQPEYLRDGNLIDAIMASSCVPVLFEMARINGVPYVDGGVTNNMPVEPIRKECKRLIGVYIIPTGQIKSLTGMVHVAERAFYLTVSSKAAAKEHMFDIYIAPEEIVNYGFFDVKKARPLFKLGYETAMKVLKQ